MVASKEEIHEKLCSIFVEHDPAFLLDIVKTGPTLGMQQLAERIMMMDHQSSGISAPTVGTTPAGTLGALFPTELYSTADLWSRRQDSGPQSRKKALPAVESVHDQKSVTPFHPVVKAYTIAPIKPPPSMHSNAVSHGVYWPLWQSGAPKQSSSLLPLPPSILPSGNASRQPFVQVEVVHDVAAAILLPSGGVQASRKDTATQDAPSRADDAPLGPDDLEDEHLASLLAELTGAAAVGSSSVADSPSPSNSLPCKPSDSVGSASLEGGLDPPPMRELDKEAAKAQTTTDTVQSHAEKPMNNPKNKEVHSCDHKSEVVCGLCGEQSAESVPETHAIEISKSNVEHPTLVSCGSSSDCMFVSVCQENKFRCLGCVLSVSDPPLLSDRSCSDLDLSGASANQSEAQSCKTTTFPLAQVSLAAIMPRAAPERGSSVSSLHSLSGTTSSVKQDCNTIRHNNGGGVDNRNSGNREASYRHKKGATQKPRQKRHYVRDNCKGDHKSSSSSSIQSWDDPSYIPNRAAAVSQLKSILPDEEEGLLGDLLASHKDDVPAVLQMLLDMQQEAQALHITATIDRLEAPNPEQPQERLSDTAKLALLQMSFPHIGSSQLNSVLQASGGSLGEAEVLLHVSLEQEAVALARRKAEEDDRCVAHAISEEVSKCVAEGHRRAAEESASLELAARLSGEDGEAARRFDAEAANAAIARHIAAQQVDGPRMTFPSPLASPDDLAAIAALEQSTHSKLLAQQPLFSTPLVPDPPSFDITRRSSGATQEEELLDSNPALELYSDRRPSRHGWGGAPSLKRRSACEGRSNIRDRDLYKKLMAPASELYSARERLCREASAAVRKGQDGLSKRLIRQSLVCQQQARELERNAIVQIERAKNKAANHGNGRLCIDLHGHHPRSVTERLVEVSEILIKSRGALESAVIVTGKGMHSTDGRAILRPLVENWLTNNWADKWRPLPNNYGAFEMFAEAF